MVYLVYKVKELMNMGFGFALILVLVVGGGAWFASGKLLK